MGCSYSTLCHKTKDRQKILSHCKDFDFVLPEPDLGWRHLSDDSPHDSIEKESESIGVDIITNEDSKNEYKECSCPAKNLYGDGSYPSMGWNLRFINNHTGMHCYVALPILALNVAIRASALANSFGVRVKELDADSRDETGHLIAQKKIYRLLQIPDYKWKLIDRSWTAIAPNVLNNNMSDSNFFFPNADEYDEILLQKMRDRNDRMILTDCGAIGINLSEQLRRLERQQTQSHRLPTELLGWGIPKKQPTRTANTFYSTVVSPDNESVMCIPEELVMNVASWIQDTYFTQAAF